MLLTLLSGPHLLYSPIIQFLLKICGQIASTVLNQLESLLDLARTEGWGHDRAYCLPHPSLQPKEHVVHHRLIECYKAVNERWLGEDGVVVVLGEDGKK